MWPCFSFVAFSLFFYFFFIFCLKLYHWRLEKASEERRKHKGGTRRHACWTSSWHLIEKSQYTLWTTAPRHAPTSAHGSKKRYRPLREILVKLNQDLSHLPLNLLRTKPEVFLKHQLLKTTATFAGFTHLELRRHCSRSNQATRN